MSVFLEKPVFWGGLFFFLDDRKPTWRPPCVLWWSVWMTECDVWRWHPNRVPMTQVKWSTSVRTEVLDHFCAIVFWGPGVRYAWNSAHFDNWKWLNMCGNSLPTHTPEHPGVDQHDKYPDSATRSTSPTSRGGPRWWLVGKSMLPISVPKVNTCWYNPDF